MRRSFDHSVGTICAESHLLAVIRSLLEILFFKRMRPENPAMPRIRSGCGPSLSRTMLSLNSLLNREITGKCLLLGLLAELFPIIPGFPGGFGKFPYE
jgi:hypothetical protein